MTASLEAKTQYIPENPPEPEAGRSYTISATASPSVGGWVSPDAQKVKPGQAATVTAWPNSDYSFLEWRDDSGMTLSKEESYKIVMPEHNVSLIAVFRYNPGNPTEPSEAGILQKQVLVTTKSSPELGGSVSGEGHYAVGSQVNIYAYPKTDYIFTGWTLNGIDIEDTSNPFLLTVDEGLNDITANFRYAPGSPNEPESKPAKYPLTLICSPSAGGSISPASGNRYEEGENIALTAYLNSDYQFEGWMNEEGSILSLSRNFTFTMPGYPTTLTAGFRYSPGSPSEPNVSETARNVIYGNRAATTPGENAIFTINLLNIDKINGINIDLQLPDGPIFDLDATVPGQRVGMHTLAIEPLEENGAWRLKLRSNEEFSGSNGTLLRIPVTIPASLDSGNSYEVVLSHGVVLKTDGSQEAVNVSNGMISLSSDNQAVLNSPDFFVSSIDAESAEYMPGDTVSVNWTVQNAGNKDAIGGWSESLFLTDTSGRRAMLGTVFYDGTGLKAKESVSRFATMVIPRLPGISGRLNIGVTMLPYLATDEPIQLQANNTTVSEEFPISLGKRLILTLPDIITGGIDSNIRAQIARSGSWAETEVFTLSAEGADPRLEIPSSVIIPREQSAAWFPISLSRNDEVDIPSTVELTASGENYESVTVSMSVKDSHLPKIGLSFDPDEATEGQTVNLTASIPYPIDKDVLVNLSSARPDRLRVPESIGIPANQTSANAEITAVDNKTIDGHQDIAINASADGFESSEDYLFVIDNDMPDLEMRLSPEEVSENVGPVGIHGVITRTSNLDQRVTILLSEDDSQEILFATNRIVMQPGESSVEFSAGIYDNDQVDGDRVIELTAAVFVSSCSGPSIGGLSGSVCVKNR
ncbi:MAG: hypothetical protein K2L00_10530, partial [Muribaculaceae bacterium]|nr:hypothetical protein [Muribaculaceae bacterium]